MAKEQLASVRIRLARTEDAANLARIYGCHCSGSATFATDPPSPAEFRERIRGSMTRHIAVVAEAANRELCGYAFGTPYRSKSAYDWTAELSCYLRPEWQGQGLGSVLCGTVISALRRQGYTTLLASVTVPNAASVALAASLGFERIGTFVAVANKAGKWLWWQMALRTALELEGSTPPPVPLDLAFSPTLLARLQRGVPCKEAPLAIAENAHG